MKSLFDRPVFLTLLALACIGAVIRSPKDQTRAVAANASLTPVTPPVATVPQRVQTYKFAAVGQATNGSSCATNWFTATETNTFQRTVLHYPTNCDNTIASDATNYLLLWMAGTNTTIFGTNLGLTMTRNFIVTTNPPYLAMLPLPTASFILLVEGTTDLSTFVPVTSVIVTNRYPSEFFRLNIKALVP